MEKSEIEDNVFPEFFFNEAGGGGWGRGEHGVLWEM